MFCSAAITSFFSAQNTGRKQRHVVGPVPTHGARPPPGRVIVGRQSAGHLVVSHPTGRVIVPDKPGSRLTATQTCR